MDPVSNPYTPGAGSRPPALAGRDEELRTFEILLERLRRGRSEKSMLITGLRGVGKTVLLDTFERIAEDAKFATAFSEITHETDFRAMIARDARRTLLSISPVDRMKQMGRRAVAVFKAFSIKVPDGPEISVDMEAALGHGDSGDVSEDLTDLFIALGRAAKEHKTGVVFFFDEIQFLARDELEALIAALHRVSQQALPLTLIGAGLPQIPELTGAAKSYSERLFNFPKIGMLPAEEARRALVVPAEAEGAGYEDAAVEVVLAFTEGYPYFLQEYGKHVWNLADGPMIRQKDARQARRHVQLHLDDNFFRVRIARCTTAELEYLTAMAKIGDGPYKSGEIAKRMGKSGPQNVAATRARVIEKGLVYSPSYGLNAFTVPHFADYMRRSFPSSQQDAKAAPNA
jgi:hypothetical protein